MVGVLIGVYVVMGFISYIGLIKWIKGHRLVDWEDIFLGMFACAFWPVFIFAEFGIGDAILELVNKKH